MTYKYSRKQWCILLIYCAINLLCAASVSIQGPFYPAIAEQKGVTPTQYGFVFGVFNIVFLVMNSLVGILIGKFGASSISFSGLCIIGGTNILFGFVNEINGYSLFLGLSIVIRVLEAVGFAMVRNAGIAITSLEFSENAEMAFAFINAFFSFGQFLGPVSGGALYEIGGFYLPFTTVGVLLICVAIAILFLPKNYPKSETKSIKDILRMHRNSSVILGVLTSFGVNANCGLILAVLEPHLKSLNLSAVEIGSMFLSDAIALAISSMVCGKLCEKYEKPSLIGSICALTSICGLLLIGPAPYMPLSKSVCTCVVGLLIHGIGAGGQQVAGFSSINKGAKIVGLPQNIRTYGIVSAIFTSSIAVGFFVGTLLGGYLFETFGFPWASHFFISYHVILFIGSLIYFRILE